MTADCDNYNYSNINFVPPSCLLVTFAHVDLNALAAA